MSSAPWTSTALQKPQTPLLFLPTPLSHSRTIQFYKLNHNLTVKPLNSYSQPPYGSVSPPWPQNNDHDEDEDDDEPPIGDCLVYEEGIFTDPFIENTTNSRNSNNINKDADVSPENLIPEEWLDVQMEINITKKERRKMAQELEYGTRVEKRRLALMPIDSEGSEKTRQEKFEQMRLDKFERIKQEKIKQLSPVVLDNPKKAYFRELKPEKEANGEVSGGRVAPRNPRLAVYGGGLEDVSEFFSSGKYEKAAADKSQGIFAALARNIVMNLTVLVLMLSIGVVIIISVYRIEIIEN